ncbi:sugar phosphate isomerase/epimerase [Pedobacter petrophilus]|uniref:Sugar phosphate isomerase/epimerase n=1 Tax=Pedobacter petrophilus TaxID=1908241 RepID=A0A7K0G0U6_9SPHI|nr:sugar phosphate isomerase/epimerase [Pedobacter petrophilus]MRX76954.1 sugar phosphate isomerase/epimerase [Pedobacter petrophilus]
MKIKYFCPRWGAEQISWNEFCSMVKNAGYDGVEAGMPINEIEKIQMGDALKQHDLLLVGQYYQSFEKDFTQHSESFKKYLYKLASLNPVLIDSQTGKDYYTAEQNRQLFEMAEVISNETGITIAHETHRNKALFAVRIAKELLIANPEIVITADFSHWCNVSESLLEDHNDAIELAISRAVHIHARVGYSQSAQVSDPRSPQWTTELQTHLNWWDAIVKYRRSEGADLLSISPEFGPFPYMPAIPYTAMPIANQWDINVYMMNLLKQRYPNN